MSPEPRADKRPWLLAGISRNTLLLGLVSFFNDVSSDMIQPHLLAIFLSSVLNVSAAGIGLIGGITDAVASVLKALSGWLSDALRRRKPTILAGYWIAACARPLLAMSTSMWHVLVLRSADRLGKGARSAPRDALIADSTPEGYRGKAFGLHRALDTAGAAAGMLLAAFLLWRLGTDHLATSLRIIFLAASLPGILVIGLIVWGVREQANTAGQASRPAAMWHLKQALTRELVKWYAVVFLFWLGNSSDMFLILKARGLGVALWQVPLLVFVMSVVYAGFSIPAGLLSDRLGRRAVIVAGWTFYALVYIGFAFAGTVWTMFALFAAYGLYYAMTGGAERALVADLAAPAVRGTALGLYHFVSGAAALPASVICGALWEWDRLGVYGPRVALGFGAACALLAIALLVVMNPKPRAVPQKA